MPATNDQIWERCNQIYNLLTNTIKPELDQVKSDVATIKVAMLGDEALDAAFIQGTNKKLDTLIEKASAADTMLFQAR